MKSITKPAEPIIIGKVGRPHGLDGWSYVISYTEPVTNLLNYQPWWLKHLGKWQLLEKCDVYQNQAGKLLVKFPDSQDRTAASQYTNAQLAVERSQLPDPGENEYYWTDLIGLTVINQENKVLGNIESMLETGSHDVMFIKDGKDSIAIPYRFGITVVKIDLTHKQMHVDWEE